MISSQLPQGQHQGTVGRQACVPGQYRRRLLAWAALATCLSTTHADAANYVWKNGTGSWTSGTGWSIAGVPGATDTATLSTGTATLSVNQSVATLVLSGSGTRSGTGTLTVGSLDWSGGTFSGAGTTTVTGVATISGSIHEYISGGHTLSLQGQTTWSVASSSYVLYVDGGLIRNNTGATFTDSGTASANGTHHLGASPNGTNTQTTFANEGAYVRTGLGTTRAYGLANTGLIDVQGGTLALYSPSTVAGQVVVAAGAVLEFGSGVSSLSATTSGGGIVRIGGGTVSLDSPAVLGSTLELAGGVLDVQANQSFSSFVFNGGTLQGAGQSTVTGQTTLTATGGSSARIDAGHTLTLQGNTLWDAAGGRVTLNGAMVNAVGATVTDTGSGTHYLGNGGTGVFNNAGTYVRSGTGTTNATGFNNTGLLDVRGGVFSSRGNSTLGGTTTLAASGVLGFVAGTSSITGAVSGPGVVRVNGGTLNLGSSANVSSTVEVSSGTLAAQSANSLSRLVLSGGTRNGTGTLTVGSLDWSGGTFGGMGTTVVTGASTINLASTAVVDAGHTLQLQGNTTWGVGTQHLYVSDGLIRNEAGATFTDAGTTNANNTRYLGYNSQTGITNQTTFANEGAYVRTGLGTTRAYGLANTGLIDVQGGTLSVNKLFTNQGTVNVASGATLAALESTFNNAGLLRGDGTVRTLNNSSALTNTGTIDPGAAGSIGHLTVEGDLSLATQSILHIDLGSSNTADLISVSDQLTLGGSLQLGLLDGALLHEGDVFTIATFASSLGSGFTSVDWGGAGGYGFSVVYNAHDIQLRVASVPMPVPEPANAALALCALVLMRLRRRPASAPSRPR
jgi:hypothetical protein